MTIEFKEHPVEWYVEKLKNNEYFSFSGFSDAEWLAMEKCKVDGKQRTGGGQLYTNLIGDQLVDALKVSDESYYKAAPLCMYEHDWVYGARRMAKFMSSVGLPSKDWVFYERDMVTDDLARAGGINPWIKQLREMDVCFVSNKYVANISYFMPYKRFVEIPKLDVYEEEDWLNRYTREILKEKHEVYVFAAGFAAAPLIGALHGATDAFFLDLGSMWDGFVGIGSSRGWRKELYEDEPRWEEWVNKVLEGIPFDMGEAKRVRDIGFNREKVIDHENG